MEVFWDSCPGEYVSQCSCTIVLCMQSLPSSHTLLRLKLCAIACWTVTLDCTDEIQRKEKHPTDAETEILNPDICVSRYILNESLI